MANDLSFERPLIELKNKIIELEKFMQEKNIDLTAEILTLKQKASILEQEIYGKLSAWQKTQIARSNNRPTTLDYIAEIFTDFLELHGDRFYGDDLAIVGGIAKIDNLPVTVIGHQKGRDTKENIKRNFGMAHPEGYRKALRLMQQADKFSRPIITFIDTAGAYPGVAAEERGQSEAIARNLREMASFGVPIIVIVTGEGGSGGALAIGVGNRIYMLENSIYSVISPEGAAALLWKDASLAAKAAETMKITAQDLYSFKIIDGIIKEPLGGAQQDPKWQAIEIKKSIILALQELLPMSKEELKKDRYEKYRKIGKFGLLY